MEEYRNESSRPVNPRRRKPTKEQIFKEKYLPLIILALTVIVILVIVIGSITRAVQRKQLANEIAQAAAEEEARLNMEASDIQTRAEMLVRHYDYEGAISLINSFSGSLADYPTLSGMLTEYQSALDLMVPWEDPNSIVNLSFNMLMADPTRAFANEEYGSAFRKNYLTLTEFSNILDQLYANGYILVRPEDFVTSQFNDDGSAVYTAKPIYLPADKKPVILTQTNVNYDTYLIDSDGDGLADAGGSGFASKLVTDSTGYIQCEYVDASGQTLYGAYDMIPILDAFVEEHPDFSYKGAKAVIAVSGHEGVFGYRTTAEAEETMGSEYVYDQTMQATEVADVLRANGYELACYTYENTAYGMMTLEEIQADIGLWTNEVLPIIGEAKTMVFAQNSDLSDGLIYMGDKHNTLQNAGFYYYLGFCTDGQPWTIIVDDYIRQGRVLVNGTNLYNNAEWFTGLFDASTVLDTAARGD
ncbi:MAG: hypothetical protein IJO45_00155 [Oscillospiraceae bacterium]|nr:hypothetical protein [Oscillospiraceae bacterium]